MTSHVPTPSATTEIRQWMHEITPALACRFLTKLANLSNAHPDILFRFSRAFGPWIDTLFEPVIKRSENRNRAGACRLGAALQIASRATMCTPTRWPSNEQ